MVDNAAMPQMVSAVGESVLSGYLGLEVTALEEKLIPEKKIRSEHVSVIIQILGEVEGQVVCSLDQATALQIVGRMFGGMEVQELDEMGWSAIKEFGNWFVSGIASQFATRGITINITHPLVNEGNSVFHSDSDLFLTPLQSTCGDIDVYYSLKESA